MPQILGIGGVFFKARDPAALADWYLRVFGLQLDDWGHSRGLMFPAAQLASKPGAGQVFSAFADTNYFQPSDKDFMINLCVDDMAGVLVRAKEAGVEPVKTQDEIYGKFAHFIDPEGIKIELWEPAAPPKEG